MEPMQLIAVNVTSWRSSYRAAGMVCLAVISNLAAAASAVAPALKTQVQAHYGKLPLSFEANQGQTDARVKFLARGQGYALFLTPTEAVLSLKKPQVQAKASPASAQSLSAADRNGAVLRMQFVGANPAPRVLGREALPGRANYLIGKDPAKWHTQIPTYGKVGYEGVYPGVDLVYYGNQEQLEYDFVVAPGADPQHIKLAFRGADHIEVNPAGELVLHTPNGDIRLHKPAIYQELAGIRKPIDGGYVFKGGQSIGFQVAAYDAAQPLIIDPVLVYSTYLGGSGTDLGRGIAVDRQGQAYVTGLSVSSTDFPIENGLQPTLGGSFDAFVAQLTADGRALRYSTYLGGSGDDSGSHIAVDLLGRASVTGSTSSSDFPTEHALQPDFGGGITDAFVAQLTADGSALRYSTYLGGTGTDQGFGIAVDLLGRASVTGFTNSDDFPTEHALQPTFGGSSDAFVAQLTANGRALRYSTYLGGTGSELGLGIAVDLLGRASVTGSTSSSDFPTENALQPTLGGITDAFVAQLTADGRALRYSTYLGGRSNDQGREIAVDLLGRASVTGNTSSSDFPTEHALQPTLGGGRDVFVAQLRADGKALRYSTYLGGSANDDGLGIAVDLRGRASVTGDTASADFPTENALQPTLGGSFDAFVAQLTADGRALRYSTYLGGRGNDQSQGIAVDLRGQAYVTGSTSSSDFPTEHALQPTSGGGRSDAFVAKIANDDRPCKPGKPCQDDHEELEDHQDRGKDK